MNKFIKGDLVGYKFKGKLITGIVTHYEENNVWAIWDDEIEDGFMPESDLILISKGGQTNE